MKNLIKKVVGLCLGLGTIGFTAITAGTVYDLGTILTNKAIKKFDEPSKKEEDSTTNKDEA